LQLKEATRSRLLIVVDLVSDLPNLKNIIFCTRCHHESFVVIPGDVRNLGCVATMDEQKLRRAIFTFFFGLRLVNSSKVPNVHPAIAARRSQEISLKRTESDLVDFFFVASQREKLALDVSGVPNCH
jgi:hypothetical protein